MTDVCEISPSNASKGVGPIASDARAATLGHISFAVGPIHSMTDSEYESQRSRASQSEDGQERGLEKGILDVKGSRVSTNA